MELLLDTLTNVLSLPNLLLLLAAVVVGIIIGAIPGLTVTMAVALAVPFTIHMQPSSALVMLLGIYCAGVYGGSISAILINTPGTPAAAATTLDGYEMAKQGRAGKALKMAILASVYGGLFSTLVLILVAPQLAEFALRFGPAEITTLLVFALTIVGALSGESMLKGLLAAGLGMTFATVGRDPMVGVPRFTFGLLDLEDGLAYMPVLIGLFAISELLVQAETGFRGAVESVRYERTGRGEADRVTREDLKESWITIVRSGLLGTFIGILPGIGSAVATFLGYGEAKRASRNPEKFGRGTVEGVAASEAANNAVTGSALIPLLALSIPGDVVTAILYSAFLIQGVTVGPLIFQQHLGVVYTVYLGLVGANVMMVIVSMVALPLFARVVSVSKVVLFPLVFVLCVVGSYAIRNNLFDVGVMFGTGALGYAMRKVGMPLAPFLIAFILCRPLEEALRQSLIGSEGNLLIFVTRPLALLFLLLAAGAILLTVRRQRKGRGAMPQEV